MSRLINPARKFEFTISGVLPSNAYTDEELQLILLAQRNLLCGIIAVASQAVATDPGHVNQITISPYLGPISHGN